MSNKQQSKPLPVNDWDEHAVVVYDNGDVAFVYDDGLFAALRPVLPEVIIGRASNVEPRGDLWEVKLTPELSRDDDPSAALIGAYSTRAVALREERLEVERRLAFGVQINFAGVPAAGVV